MDTNNGKPTTSGEPTVDAGDWRTQMQPDSRQRIVSKIMDTLKRHLPFSGQEGLNELRKIAVRFEEKIFTAASSQSDYLRRISLKMLTMETKSQTSIPNTGNNSEHPDPVSQGMQNQVSSQGQSIPIPLYSNQSQAHQQLLAQNVQNNMASTAVQSSAGLQSAVPSVCGPSQNPIPNVVGQNFNMQNLSGISQNSLQQGIPSNNFANQQRQMQGRQQVLPQQQRVVPETSSTSLDSTAQTGHANGGDWQEGVYQKIQTMKETYLPEINEMYQKITVKLQQHDSLPQQPKSEQLEKLRIFKNMLERIVAFLSVSKANIDPGFKDKLSSYEKQIINFVNTNWPRKPVSLMQQGQLPPSHMYSMQQSQPQVNQTESHDNQVNPQLHSINLQGSVPTMQSNMVSPAVQSSAGLQSAMPSVCGLTQNPIPNVVGQNSNMQHLSGISQNSLQQGIPSNNFTYQQRQMQGRKQVLPQQKQQELQQQQQQLYRQQLQHQLMKQRIQQGNLQRSLMQSNMPLQQQQQLLLLQLHLTQLQSSRQSGMQASSVMHPSAAIQSTPLPSLQQNQESSLQQSTQTMLQKRQQSVLWQQQQTQQSASVGIGQKQTPITQQAMMPQQTGHAIGDDWQGEIYEKTPSIPSTSTLLSPSPTPGNFEKPIYGAKQANDEQAGSGCLVPESVSIGMSAQPLLAESKSANDTYGNALKTYFGKSNVAEQPHYPRVTMAKPMSVESLSTSVVTMVDEAAAAVGEDFASMRKHGLDARNFFTKTGLTGAEKVRFYTAIVALALIFWCIFFIYLQY